MKILGFNKLTAIDYPDTIAALIFTYGCNLLCPFCHNPSLVLHPNQIAGFIDENEVLGYLSKRKNVLGGLCISGGEPLLQPDLAEFIIKVKELGLKVKLDTNGILTKRLQKLLETNLLDYVAIDIKNSQAGYPKTVGKADFDISSIKDSVELVRESGILYEFRTTLANGLHEEKDLEELGAQFGGKGKIYLQNFKRADSIINDYTNETPELTPFSAAQLDNAKRILAKYFEAVEIRQ